MVSALTFEDHAIRADVCIRLTDDLTWARGKSEIAASSHSYGSATFEDAALIRWRLTFADHAVRVDVCVRRLLRISREIVIRMLTYDLEWARGKSGISVSSHSYGLATLEFDGG